MYNFNGTYINPADILYVKAGADPDPEYQFGLVVVLRSGDRFAVKYRTRLARDQEARNISDSCAQATPVPLCKEEVDRIISKAIDSLRRDLRRLRQELRDKEV